MRAAPGPPVAERIMVMESAPPAPVPEPTPTPQHTVRRPVVAAARPRRSNPAALVAVLLLLLVAAAAGGWYLTRDPSTPTADPGTEQTPDERTSTSPAETAEPSPEETAEPSAEASDPGDEDNDEEPAVDADDPASFVAEYYTLLPEDTETSWQMLSSELQNDVGRDSYEGFWASVQDVSVDDVTEESDGVVLATITYTTDRGTEQEQRRLVVGEAGGGYVITDDPGPVSR